ncbi:MAG: CRISPR-associated endonuclease Cas3'' [Candidatus Nitrosocaldaceae archaeon]|nr:MAG: CRISPR-associated endonuclease Cas3'' [Candidatus Nitrosocaldaceae archaeon]
MNNDILSYYDGNRKELLKEHIKLALKYIKHLENSRIYRMANNIEPKADFKNIVRLAVIFHDAGKAFIQYKRDNYISFRGHELVSAIIIDKFVRELCLDEYYSASTFAVMYHHHAMNFNFRKAIKIGEAINNKNSASNLKKVLNIFLNNNERDILDRIFKQLDNLLKDQYLNVVECELFRRVSGKNGSKVRKISYLTLNTLMAADYLSAREGRSNDTRSNFYNAIEEFYKIYIKDNNI